MFVVATNFGNHERDRAHSTALASGRYRCRRFMTSWLLRNLRLTRILVCVTKYKSTLQHEFGQLHNKRVGFDPWKHRMRSDRRGWSPLDGKLQSVHRYCRPHTNTLPLPVPPRGYLYIYSAPTPPEPTTSNRMCYGPTASSTTTKISSTILPCRL